MVAALLALAVFVLYLPAGKNAFVLYDDDLYITENAMVTGGLSWEGIVWAFTSFHGGNWHPLTWISHMLDVTLFGVDPTWHHLASVGIHALATALLLLLLNAMTGTVGPPVLVAALFAVHPLHVESVVWAAERKDVLMGVFWILTTLEYLRYVRMPSVSRYLVVIGFFICALLAKPAVVALPLSLLVLDFWPLGRLVRGAVRRMFFEKVPLFALAAASAAITYVAQELSGGLLLSETSPLLLRVANAAASTVSYLRKTAWPTMLAHYYPFPLATIPWQQTCRALAVVALISVAAWFLRRRHPAVISGWVWFLVTVAPMIGIVQTGAQAMADRYMYLPLIGIFLAIAWEGRAVGTFRRVRISVITAAGLLFVVALVPVTRRQIGYWRDTVVLSQHTLSVTRDNWFVENNLGLALSAAGKQEEAMGHYREVLRIKPGDARALNNMGVALFRLDRFDEAVVWFSRAAHVEPGNSDVRNNLAAVRNRQNRDLAFSARERLTEGAVLAEKGLLREAEVAFLESARLDPGNPDTWFNLGLVLVQQRRSSEAERPLLEALRLRPDFPGARTLLRLVREPGP